MESKTIDGQEFELLNREFRGSGRKMRDFCKEKGINYYRFRNLRAAQTRMKKPETRGSKFVELKLTGSTEYAIVLTNGVKITAPVGFRAEEIKTLIAACQ